MKKPKYYHDKTYSQEFWLFIGMSRKDFMLSADKHLNADLSESFTEANGGGCVELDTGQIIVWTDKSTTAKDKASVIAHECFHAVGIMFDNLGIRYSLDHDEPWAYMISRLVEECYK